MTPLLADVVVPEVWHWSNTGPWFVLGALIIEAIVFCLSTAGAAASMWSRVLAVVTANIVSFLAGFFILLVGVPLLPPAPLTWSLSLTAIFFLVACVLSVVLEYLVYFSVPPWRRLPRLVRAVVLSNLASYAILFVAFKIL